MKKQEFKDLKLIFEKLKENQKEINNLYEIQKQLRAEADKKLRLMSKVVCLKMATNTNISKININNIII